MALGLLEAADQIRRRALSPVELTEALLGQIETRGAALRAFDASGANEVVAEDMASNVPNGANGSRILIATPSFANYTDIYNRTGAFASACCWY